MKEQVIQVSGMNCNHCKQTVEKAVASTGAVGQVDLATGTVHVQYDEVSSSLPKILEAIEDQGFDASL